MAAASRDFRCHKHETVLASSSATSGRGTLKMATPATAGTSAPAVAIPRRILGRALPQDHVLDRIEPDSITVRPWAHGTADSSALATAAASIGL